MKIETTFFNSLRHGACGASLAVLGLAMLSSQGAAQIVSMNNGGSTATVNLGSSAGMNYWSVNGPTGQNQLDQQWFWYSINGGPSQSIDTIASQPGGSLTYSLSLDQSTLNAKYSDPTLSVSITYALQGSGVGSDSADLQESINVANNSGSAFNVNFYQYSNFNLLQNNQNTISVFGSPGAYSTIVQSTVVGGNGIEETIDNPLANFAEAGLANTVLADVAAGNALNGTTSAGPGNVGWAFEWAAGIGSGNNLDIYKDKNLSIQPVPEPSTLALIGLGLGAVGMLRRRLS